MAAQPIHMIYVTVMPDSRLYLDHQDFQGPAGDRLVELGVLHRNLVHPPADCCMSYDTRYKMASRLVQEHLLNHGIISHGLLSAITAFTLTRYNTLPSRRFPVELSEQGVSGNADFAKEPFAFHLLANGMPYLRRGTNQPHPSCVTSIITNPTRPWYRPTFGKWAANIALAAHGVDPWAPGAVRAFFGDEHVKYIYLPVEPVESPEELPCARKAMREAMRKARGIQTHGPFGPRWIRDRDSYLLSHQRGTLEECLRNLRFPFAEEDFAWARNIDGIVNQGAQDDEA